MKKEDGSYTEGARSMFDLIDTSGDGFIDFKDYLFGLALVNEGEKNRGQLMKLAFKSFDKEGVGLNLAQFSNLMSWHPKLEKADKAAMFNKADGNGDGRITYQDFEKLLKSSGAEGLVDVFKVEFLNRSAILARKKKWKPKEPKVKEEEGGEGGKNDNRV